MRNQGAVAPSLLAAVCFVVVAILTDDTVPRIVAAVAARCFVVVAARGYFARGTGALTPRRCGLL
jgi:hypothetical protein